MEAKAEESKEFRILVVEDDTELCMLIKRLTESTDLPVEVVYATTVHEAVMWIDEHGHFDLVLADFMLADSRNGYELREICRERMPSTNFAMMSSMPIGAPGVEQDKFLRKPFTMGECQKFLEMQLAG